MIVNVKQAAMFKRILVVCIGNICRSPLAGAMLANRLPHVQVTSAGLGALVGKPADENVLKLAGRYGVDLSSHCAKQISAKLLEAADLIFVMDQKQKQFLTEQYPHLHGRVLLLSHFSAPGLKGANVEDPYKQDEAVFVECARQIALHVDAIHQTLFSTAD